MLAQVGASMWDLYLLLKDFDTESVSANYDIGHATVEGGYGGWIHSARLLMPYMRGRSREGLPVGEKRKRRLGTGLVPAW